MKMNIVAALAQDLDRLKGWDTAYTSSNKNQMIIWLCDNAYKVTLEPVEGSSSDLVKLIAGDERK